MEFIDTKNRPVLFNSHEYYIIGEDAPSFYGSAILSIDIIKEIVKFSNGQNVFKLNKFLTYHDKTYKRQCSL